FILNGLNTADQLVAKGVIIVAAVLLQRQSLKSAT
ncbi:ABC transporter permease, partial [Microbispora triticiradicis]